MLSGRKFGFGFFVGLAAGSILGLLYAPKSGRELRSDIKDELTGLVKKAEERKNQIVNKAKDIAANITTKSEKVIESVKSYAEGKYRKPVKALENEINSIRYAVNTAVKTYKQSNYKKPAEQEADDLFIDFDDETLPKVLGMKRRPR